MKKGKAWEASISFLGFKNTSTASCDVLFESQSRGSRSGHTGSEKDYCVRGADYLYILGA